MATDNGGYTLNAELSRRVAQAVNARAKACWENAFRGLAELLDLAGVLYVEGWAVTCDHLIAVEHGWLEYDGQVIDPTLPGRVAAYFPGLRLTTDQAIEALRRKRGKLPISWASDSEAYHGALYAALAYSSAALAERQVTP